MALTLLAALVLAQPADPVAEVATRAARAAKQMRLGDQLLELGDLKGACEAYRQTTDILSSWWMPRLALVRCGRFTGVPIDELIEHARFAVRARPRIPITHSQLGLVLEEAGRTAEATAAYRAALNVDERMYDVRYRLGMLLAADGKNREAVANLLAVVRRQPHHVVAWRKLARLHETLGQHEHAERALQRLVVESRYPSEAIARLIRFYGRRRMPQKARRARQVYRDRFAPAEAPSEKKATESEP